MRLPAPVVEAFNDSLDLCVADPTFFDRFYGRFTGASSEIAAMFRAVPMVRQKRMLKASLYTALMAADGNEAALEHLAALGTQHSHLGLRRRHYELWLACLVASVEETPAIERAGVEEAWRRVLERAVEIMARQDGSEPAPTPPAG